MKPDRLKNKRFLLLLALITLSFISVSTLTKPNTYTVSNAISDLTSGNTWLIEKATRFLNLKRPDNGHEEILKMFDEQPNKNKREALLRALALAYPKHAKPIIYKELKSSDHHRKHQALLLSGHRPLAIPSNRITPLLKDSRAPIRIAALRALLKKGPRLLDKIKKHYKNRPLDRLAIIELIANTKLFAVNSTRHFLFIHGGHFERVQIMKHAFKLFPKDVSRETCRYLIRLRKPRNIIEIIPMLRGNEHRCTQKALNTYRKHKNINIRKAAINALLDMNMK